MMGQSVRSDGLLAVNQLLNTLTIGTAGKTALFKNNYKASYKISNEKITKSRGIKIIHL